MKEEEIKEIIENMSEQELNEYIFFALKEVDKKNTKLKYGINTILNKLICFEFETDDYKDLDFISSIIQDLKMLIEGE